MLVVLWFTFAHCRLWFTLCCCFLLQLWFRCFLCLKCLCFCGSLFVHVMLDMLWFQSLHLLVDVVSCSVGGFQLSSLCSFCFPSWSSESWCFIVSQCCFRSHIVSFFLSALTRKTRKSVMEKGPGRRHFVSLSEWPLKLCIARFGITELRECHYWTPRWVL